MSNYREELKNLKEFEDLYTAYPILKKINENNNKIISLQSNIKTVYADEYINGRKGACQGILFVIKGMIKIQKINKDGEETNLYNIESGEFCHEALSCLSSLESLNIAGKAVQDSKVCIIPFEVVRKYLIQDNEFLLYIYEDLYRKFNSVIGNKEEIIHESIETRLVKFLISQNSKIIYITHNQLAFEVDTAREVVSRKLKSIEKKGYIRLERGKIIILKNLNEIIEM